MDVDAERLDVVGGLARRMLDKAGLRRRAHAHGRSRRAPSTARDFVLLQIRVGGQAARLQDETAPLACGCIGQETTGAGGFAKAMRTVPVVLEIAERVRERAEPGAWIVDFTNPVGIVTRALLDAGHRARRPLQRRDRLPALDRADARRRAGARARRPGRPQPPDVDPRGASSTARTCCRCCSPRTATSSPSSAALPRTLLEELGAIPSYYLHYFYAHDRVLAEQRHETPRAEVVADIERELLEMYRDPALTEKPALLEQRGGAFYSEAAVGLVSSLVTGDGAVHEVDMRNGGTLAGLADDDVVEVPARVTADGAEPLPQAPLAPELLGLAQHVAAYERLAAEAAVTRDPAVARKALLAHPLIGQVELVDGLLERLLLPEAVA